MLFAIIKRTVLPILGSGRIIQTTVFNLQLKPTDLTGIPQFYRIYFVFKLEFLNFDFVTDKIFLV